MNATYGKVTLKNKHWVVECETFVRSRIKRVFPRMRTESTHRILITASPENTRELEWFLLRFPMEVSDPAAMQRLAEEHRQIEDRVTSIILGNVAAPSLEMAVPARDYQAIVPELLKARGGLILADDLGLGKTVSAIACMASGMLPAVVVCPAHLPRQWQKMINRFLPSLRTHVIKKGSVYDLMPKRRKNSRQPDLLDQPVDEMPDVLITSYHKLRGWANDLVGKVPFIVFDEGQQLRNNGSEIYRACSTVAEHAAYRLALSATPIYNYGEEFFHVIDCVNPGALGSRDEFVREWCVPAPGQNSRLGDSKEFGAYLRREGLMLRRTRADVGRELPELEKIVHEIDADQEAMDRAIESDAMALAKVVLQHNERFRGERMQASGEFDALMRQATGVAKAPFVAEFVRMLLESGEPVVLFGWHRAVYEIWRERLAEFNPAFYTGTESATQKDQSIADFLAGRSKVLIMSLRSGAGVDGLQGFCRIAVFGEIDWSSGVHEQCMGRIHRDGADSGCLAYFLLSEVGADPIMAEVLGIKREQIVGVLNPDSALVERIDTGENNIRRLAREFLKRHGEAIPEESEVSVLEVTP